MNKNEMVKAIAESALGRAKRRAKKKRTGSGRTGSGGLGPKDRSSVTGGGGTRRKLAKTGSGGTRCISKESIKVNYETAFGESGSEELILGKKKVKLVGVGTITISNRREKTRINPITGDKITIKDKSVLIHRPGKAFKVRGK
jgi:nucleoid DNA-binding protein